MNNNPTLSYDEMYRLYTVKEQSSYSSLPHSFIIRTRDPDHFIPRNMTKYFNEKVFYNMHRQCFNACVDGENDRECYSNCKNKNLTSLELFKTAVEQQRKWNPITSYINVREYQKRPVEMGKNVPSEVDYYAKMKYIQEQYQNERTGHLTGLNDLFRGATNFFSPQKTNIFKMYMSGLFPSYTKKAIERNDITSRYEEYMKLNEEFGSKLDEILKEKEGEYSWGHITGEDFEE